MNRRVHAVFTDESRAYVDKEIDDAFMFLPLYTDCDVYSACALGVGVYTEAGKLVETAVISVYVTDISMNYDIKLDFIDEDGYDVCRYRDGLPILCDSKIILKADGTREIVGNKVMFLPSMDRNREIAGFWVFRLRDLSVSAYISVKELPDWIDKMARNANNYENVELDLTRNVLKVRCYDKIVHIADIPLLAEKLNLYSYNNMKYNDFGKLEFIDPPAPCKVFYLPDMCCVFNVELSPLVGSEHIMIGKTRQGRLVVNSDKQQKRTISCQGISADMHFNNGSLDISITDARGAKLNLSKLDALKLRARGTFYQVELDKIANADVQIIGDIDSFRLQNISFLPEIIGNFNKVQFDNCIFDDISSYAIQNLESINFLNTTCTKTPINVTSSKSVRLHSSNVIFKNLVTSEYAQYGNDLALGEDSTIESLALNNCVISHAHTVHNVNSLMASELTFENPDAKIILKGLPRSSGCYYLFCDCDNYDDFNVGRAFEAFQQIPIVPHNIELDFRDEVIENKLLEVALVFRNSSYDIVTAIFRNLIGGLKIVAPEGIDVKLYLHISSQQIPVHDEESFANYLVDYLGESLLDISCTLEQGGYLRRDDNGDILLTDVTIDIIKQFSAGLFALFRQNNPNVSLMFA